MREVVFHRLAQHEARDAAAWYAARSEQARQRFRAALIDSIDRIAANPLTYAQFAGPFRLVRTRRFPYAIVYEVRPDDSVFVVAIAHTSRRPGYWQRRK